MIVALAVTVLIAAETPPEYTALSARETLGSQLFHDTRFSSPRGDITLEEALDQKIRAAFLARMGQLRNPDPELERIHIFEDDIPALFAFLNTLNDAGRRLATPSKSPLSPSGTLSSRYSR